MSQGFSRDERCYTCVRFPLYLESEKDGWTEQCASWKRQQKWDDAACVLHLPAKNPAERERLADTLRNQKKETT